MTKPTILLVDYDPKTIESTLRPLCDAGYDVEVARDGEAGFLALGRVDPDLVLLQMMLPKKPGLELCREIRRARPRGGPPILVLGNSSAEKYRAQALASGADAYVPPATEPERLVEICNLHLMGSPVEPPLQFEPPPIPSESLAWWSPSPPGGPEGSQKRRRPWRALQTWGIIATAGATLMVGGAFVLRPREGVAPEPRSRAEMDRPVPLEAAASPEGDLRPASEAVVVPREEPQPGKEIRATTSPRVPRASVAIPRPEPDPPTVEQAPPPRGQRLLSGMIVHEDPPPQNATEDDAPDAGVAESGSPSDAPEGDPVTEAPELLVGSAPPPPGEAAWPPQSRPASVGDLVDLNEVDAPPVAASRPAPTYPASARRMHRQGKVILRLLVDETGRVERVEPLGSAASEFHQAAERAVRRWTYEPARKDGVRVKVWLTVQLVFSS